MAPPGWRRKRVVQEEIGRTLGAAQGRKRKTPWDEGRLQDQAAAGRLSLGVSGQGSGIGGFRSGRGQAGTQSSL